MHKINSFAWPFPNEERVKSLGRKFHEARDDLDYTLEQSTDDARRLLIANDMIDLGLFSEISYSSSDKSFFFQLSNDKNFFVE